MRQWSPSPLVAAFAAILTTGCQPGRPASAIGRPPASRPVVAGRPDRVVGDVIPREGLVVPPGTTVEVVVRWGSDPEQTLAVHPIRDVRGWPAGFEVAVRWPNLPENEWKALPPDAVRVFARGYVGGRATFVAQSEDYTMADSAVRRPLRLTLVPVRE